MNKGDIIKNFRLSFKMTQEDVAKKLGVTKQTLHKYETGIITNIPSDKIEELAIVFNTSPSVLMGWNKIEPELEIIGKADVINTYKYIPDPVSAGNPENIDGQNYSSISIPGYFLGKYSNNTNILIMKVNGDSMNKIIPDKSLIAILKDYNIGDLKNSDIVVFNHNYDYSVKRFFKTETKIIFKPESTDESFADISFMLNEESNNIEIVGKVIMYNVIL